MLKRFLGIVALLLTLVVLMPPQSKGVANRGEKADADLKLAASKIVHVTVYQNNALVTREVEVPEGKGTMELVVSPLPPQTVNTSLYSEGSEGLRVLTTRFRLRPVKEDTREEVRKAEAQLKQLVEDFQKIQSEIKTIQDNMMMIGKLEGFTTASATAATSNGKLDGDQIITLANYVMKERADRAKELVALQQKLTLNREQTEFVQRQLRELTAGTSKVERDAIIVVDKEKAGGGKVRLNYLVDSVGWRPQYRVRAGKGENDAIQLEYLAGIAQQTGEEWANVKMSLSTAQPMLNAAPPDLKMLSVSLMNREDVAANPGGQFQQGFQQFGGNFQGGFQFGGQGRGGQQAQGQPQQSPDEFQRQLKQESGRLRGDAANSFNMKKGEQGGKLINDAAALEQANEILVLEKEDIINRRNKGKGGSNEGQSVTYHLPTRLTVPSRNEEHVIEVARLEMKPEFCYTSVPVLTRHVYRLANLTNTTEYVLLPGEATMYNGDDFVGRMDMPLVAIGEQFTAGFGVDPQLQVVREMVDKQRSQQGGNQVLKYDYRILVSSYKTKPVKVQVWERLPRSETETVNVTVVKTSPELCADPLYVREKRPHNILRWDLEVKPGMSGEKAVPVSYEFKVELDKNMVIGGFLSR